MPDDRFQFRHYKALPLAGLSSPLIDRLGKQNFPARNRMLIDSLKDSIQVNGMRNPLTIEWFDPYDDRNQTDPSWAVRIGNNRLIALLELGVKTAPALVIVPEGVEGLAGTYERISVDAALGLFSADHPWWHSQILRRMLPTWVPPRG